jgi:hypothetical protein
MSSPIPHLLALNSSDQDIDIVGNPNGIHNLVLSFDAYPAAGTVVVKYRAPWSNSFVALAHANGISVISGPISLRIDGPIAIVRVTFTGLSGGSGARLWESTGTLPGGLFAGNAAMVVQPYAEINAKRGLQFYARAAWPLADPIAAGATRKLYFQTGSKKVIIKYREAESFAEELEIRLFASPTGVSGGTDLTIHNYNSVSPTITTVLAAKKNVVTVSDGTPFDDNDPECYFGASGAGGRSTQTSAPNIDRILPANAEFITTIKNTGSTSARAVYYLTWYEGDPDLPL